jgi:glutamate-ammonia-ligase adenylyltransferase
MSASNFRLPTTWPLPADPDAAERLCERFAELGRAEARFARGPGAALLRGLGGNSPYLGELALREATALRQFSRNGPGVVVAAAMAGIAALPPGMRRPLLAAALRQAKRVVALITALADIGGIWTLEQVT